MLSVYGELLATALDAMRSGQSTVNMAGEDLTVNTDAACFAIIDSALKVRSLMFSYLCLQAIFRLYVFRFYVCSLVFSFKI